jgi:hypothetical protein
MLVTCSAVDRALQPAADVGGQTRLGSLVRNRDVSHQESETLFTLVGKSVGLQQRFSFGPENQETVLHFKSQNKNFFCLIDDVTEQTKRETKINTKTISGGVRRASVHHRQEQKKPSTDVVYKKKTKSKNRCITIRQPLVMCTVSLPDKHLPFEEGPQIFSSTEEAKVMLRRLLASTDHECTMAESVRTSNVTQGKESQSGLLEKPEYLEGTYDYLFHRHVQTLNDIIRQQELQENDEACGIYLQKNCKQVIQLCCGDGIDCDDDASVTIGSTKSSHHHNTSTTCYHPFSCDEATGSNSQDTNQKINSNNFFANPSSCDEDGDKAMNNHCEKNESTSVNDNNQTGSCHYIQNNSDNSINLNAVTRKLNALKLKEVRSSPKPIITFNHVSNVNESISAYTESESNKLKQITTTSIPSTIRSRSSSPLLEVPAALEDRTTEMMRPPMN